MNNVVISLHENILKLSLNSKNGFNTFSTQVTVPITNTQEFAQLIKENLNTLPRRKETYLDFLVDPEDTLIKFVTVNKNDDDIDGQILMEIKGKLKEISLDDYYFSYQKLAPFVYQFVAIKKSVLNAYLEIANLIGMPIRSVIPWILLLPKFVGKNVPCIFLCDKGNKQTVALSELGGIYFAETYKEEQTLDKLKEIISSLAIYKRPVPISKIYTLDYEYLNLDQKYEVESIKLDNFAENNKGFENHFIFNSLIDTNAELLHTQLNTLNYLPVPVAETKSRLPVYIGAALGVLFIAVGGFFLLRGNGTKSNDLAANVLSETNQTTESTKSNPPAEKPILNKADLKIQVLNGAGISGAAAKARDFLTSAGYKVSEIGNSEEANRSDTLIQIKSGKADYKDALLLDVGKSYTAVADTNLPASSAFDVIVTIGAK